MNKLMIAIFSFILITSCSVKQQTKLKLSVSNIAAGGVNMPGGIMLYGHN